MLRLLNTTNRYLLGSQASWFNAEPHKPSFGETQTVTLIPGIGIGPEITSTPSSTQTVSEKSSRQLTSPSGSTSSPTSPSRTFLRETCSTRTGASCWA